MKFLVFVVLALAVTVINGSAIPYSEVKVEPDSIQPRFFDIIGSIVGVIDQIVKQVQASLDHMNTEAEKTIGNIWNQIEVFFQQAGEAFQNFFDQIENEISTLVGDKILPCLIDKPKELQAIRNETRQNIEKCVNASKVRLEELSDDVEVYVNKTSDEIATIRSSLQTCIEEPDIREKIKCAVDASRVIQSSVGNILGNIGNASQTITTKVYAIARDNRQCVTKARDEGKERTIGVLNEIRDCLAESNTENNTDNPNN